MKKVGLSLLVLAMVFVSCEDDKTKEEKKDLIIAKWKLTKLVNIGDQQKYLNSTIEFSKAKELTQTNEEGENIATGTWEYIQTGSMLRLSPGLFKSYAVDYKLLKKDADSLILERRYTKEGKDAYLEYHYKSME